MTDEQPTAHHESPIRRFLFESALIVFSILLALAVNQWADTRKQRQLTDRALTAVHAEIAANADRIRQRRPYHLSLESELKRADSIGYVHRYSDLKHAAPDWSGFENPELDATAWQSAMTLGVAPNLGFDTLQTLSSLYGLQSRFDQYSTTAIPSFDFSDEAMHSTIRRMYVFVTTMRVNEDTLLNRYAAALKLLGPQSPPAAR